MRAVALFLVSINIIIFIKKSILLILYVFCLLANQKCCRGLKCISLKTMTACTLNNRELGCQCSNPESKGRDFKKVNEARINYLASKVS